MLKQQGKAAGISYSCRHILTNSAINVVVNSIRLHGAGDALLELHGEHSRVSPHPPERGLASRQPGAVDARLLPCADTYHLKYI